MNNILIEAVKLYEVRCLRCRRLLAKVQVAAVVEVKCRDCKTLTVFKKT